ASPVDCGYAWVAGCWARVRARLMVAAVSGRGMPPSGWWGARVYQESSPSSDTSMVPRWGWAGVVAVRAGPGSVPVSVVVVVRPERRRAQRTTSTRGTPSWLGRVGSGLVRSGSRSSMIMLMSRVGCRWGHWVERYSQVRLPCLVMVRSVMAWSALLILRYA